MQGQKKVILIFITMIRKLSGVFKRKTYEERDRVKIEDDLILPFLGIFILMLLFNVSFY